MDRFWQEYFKHPTKWRNDKVACCVSPLMCLPTLVHSEFGLITFQLHAKSPGFGHKSTKQALPVNSWNNPQRVAEALEATPSSNSRLFQNDEFSWTKLISQHIKSGRCRQALRIYEEMHKAGVKPSSYTFVAALKACSNLRDLETAKHIHAEVLQSGLELHIYVGTMLVDVYAKCGSLKDARCVFEKMPHRNVVSWNAMILGYAQMENGHEALQLFTRMQQDGVVPDDRTFVAALKACSSLAVVKQGNEGDRILVKKQCLDLVRGIHSQAGNKMLVSDVFVGTMLVDVYNKCGSLVDARCVFETMARRDVVSWNAMILGCTQMEHSKEALQLYTRMQAEHVVPDSQTFVAALKACSSLASRGQGEEGDGILLKNWCLKQVNAIYADIVNSRSESDLYVATMLVDVYAKCGSLVNARRIFEKMPYRDVVSWNAMILGYTQMQEGGEALKLYAQMIQENVVPDDRIFVCALMACCSLAASELGIKEDGKPAETWCLQQVRAIHSDVVQSGWDADVFVGTLLVDAYAKCGSVVDARHVFEKMPQRDVVSWTAMILAYAQLEQGHLALQLYEQMQQEGVVPDARAFVAALKACGSVADLEKGKKIHNQILETDLVATDAFVASSLIDMYGKCGSMSPAQQVFDGLPTRDVVKWGALIAGYAHQGESRIVFDSFERMRQEGIQPDSITFLSILNVCSHVGLVDKGQYYFEAMSRDYGITPTIDHYGCMVDLLGRAGQLDKAMRMASTCKPNGVVWRTLLGACQKWRNVEVGRHAFQHALMLDKNDDAAYVLMSNIYTAAHMLDDAREVQARRVKIGK